jgi:predicted ATPase
MKAIFKNIGPVNKAELELKYLTIIAGANNTGKTYLAYTLYGFLKLMQEPFPLLSDKVFVFDIDNAVKTIRDTGKVQFNINNFNEKVKQIIEQNFRLLPYAISNIFNSSIDYFEDSEFALYPDYPLPDSLKSDLRVKLGRKNEYHMTASFEKDILSFNLIQTDQSIDTQLIKKMIISAFFKLYAYNFPESFILSAERFGISLFYKEIDFTRNRVVETLQQLENKGKINNIESFVFINEASARYAQPIKDNIDYTRDLEFIQKKNSSLMESKLFDNVKEILNGYFKYTNGEIRFISKARKKGKFDIPLHIASSSARGLSDLYFFLKHVAHKDQLLIIDEPESHLDTANQIEMARLLARCVNSGLKVLITTHSDYIIKEFNNLIMLNNNFKGKTDFLKSNKQYSSYDYLKPESVGAYICENGTLTPCNIDNKGMDIRSFDDTIDEINRISDELDFLTDTTDSSSEE